MRLATAVPPRGSGVSVAVSVRMLRVILWLWLWVWGLAAILLSCQSHAAAIAEDPSFAALSSPGFEVLSPDGLASGPESEFRYSEGLELLDFSSLNPSISERLFGWTPDGRSPGVPSPGCAPEVLERLLIADSDVSRQSVAAQEFLSRCELELSRFHRSWVPALVAMEYVRYDLSRNPGIRPVRITLPGNVRVRGVLALKPGHEPRPLVLLKCGLYCDAESSPGTRAILMHLFDESPFHVLVLSNVTGVRFAEDNRHYSLGGFDEGRHLFLVAKLIRRLPLGRLTSSIHAAGISLGGQAPLFAALYNDFNPADGGTRVFNSALSLCPVVDLEQTLRSNLAGGLRGKLFRLLTVRQILKVLSYIPILGQLFDPEDPPDNKSLREVVARGALDYYRSLGEDRVAWTLPPFADAGFESIEDLWRYNNFLNFQSWVRTPTLVWGAADDGIVPASKNVKALREAAERDPGAGAVRVLETRWGSHCASSVTHGWETMTGLLRSFVLSHSPEFTSRRLVRRQKLFETGLPRRVRLYPGEVHLRQRWHAKKGEPSFSVQFEIWSPHRDIRCIALKPWQELVGGGSFAPERECVRHASVEVSWDPVEGAGLHLPRSQAEAEALSRWANANLRVVSAAGLPVRYSESVPDSAEWDTYE